MPNNANGALERATRQARQQRRSATAALAANPRVQFADWLKSELPEVYDDAIKYAQASAGARAQALTQAARAAQAKAAGVLDTGLGFVDWDVFATDEPATTAVEEKSFWEKFTEGAIAVGTSWLVLENQKDMLKLNIARAEQGLPPIDPATTAPVIRTQVSIDPATAAALASNVGSSMNRGLLMMGAVALVVMFFVMRK